MRKRSFDPVADENTRVLVLGSLPGERSLEERRYYAHPTNGFWRLMGEVVGTNLIDLDYPERLDALLKRQVGLWDVVSEALREGSGDAAIRDMQRNNLAALTSQLPNLKALGFNGGKAWTIGSRQFPPDGSVALLPLPSSSAAHARMPFSGKLKVWMGLRAYLNPSP